MEKVKLYQIKKGGLFKHVDGRNGEPAENTYIKGKPYTDPWDHTRKLYVTFLYAPGEPIHHKFTGYCDCDWEVFKVDSPKLQL